MYINRTEIAARLAVFVILISQISFFLPAAQAENNDYTQLVTAAKQAFSNRRYELAEQLYQKAYDAAKISENTSKDTLFALLNNEGICANKNGEFDKAFDLFTEASALASASSEENKLAIQVNLAVAKIHGSNLCTAISKTH